MDPICIVLIFLIGCYFVGWGLRYVNKKILKTILISLSFIIWIGANYFGNFASTSIYYFYYYNSERVC
jgi:hypothetical protein